MAGGFGNEYGGVPWGGQSPEEGVEVSVNETLPLSEGVAVVHATDVMVADTLTHSEQVTAGGEVRVVGAIAITATRVKVTFDQPLSPSYAPNIDPSNYLIPGLTVFGAVLDTGGTFVTLTTSTQASSSYTVTVQQARSVTGDTLNLSANTATFLGFSTAPYYYSGVQSRVKIVLRFSQQPLASSALTDPASYRVWGLDRQEIPVDSVTLDGPSPYMQVALHLGTELAAFGYYVTWVSPLVETQTGHSYYPDTYVVQWQETQAALRGPGPVEVPFEVFSGEVSGGLLGSPDGQVFFSPALESPVSGSEIEVAEVSCTTQAYDRYQIPPGNPQGGIPLATWNGTAVTSVMSGNHLKGNRTWAPKPLFGDASLNVADRRADTKAPPVDSQATATLTETLDPSRGSRTNGVWRTGPGTVAYPFIIADNLTPIGPGTTQVIPLQP